MKNTLKKMLYSAALVAGISLLGGCGEDCKTKTRQTVCNKGNGLQKEDYNSCTRKWKKVGGCEPLCGTEETKCDGKDDDCNGKIDEGLEQKIVNGCGLDGADTLYQSCKGGKYVEDQCVCIEKHRRRSNCGLNGFMVEECFQQNYVLVTNRQDCPEPMQINEGCCVECVEGKTKTEECGAGKIRVMECQGEEWKITYNECLSECEPGTKETRNCYPSSLPQETRNVGECKDGTQTRVCKAGRWDPWSECQNYTGPVAEVCDNKNNDCDTAIDESLVRWIRCGLAKEGIRKENCSAGNWLPEECQEGKKYCGGINNSRVQRRPCQEGGCGSWGECDYDRELVSQGEDGRFPQIQGKKVVWQYLGENNRLKIKFRDLETKETEEICPQEEGRRPAIWEDKVVYEGFQENWEIFSHDLRSRENQNISNWSASDLVPVVYGNLTGWKQEKGDLYSLVLHNELDNTLTEIYSVRDSGERLSLFEGQLAFSVESENDDREVYVYDQHNGQLRNVSDSQHMEDTNPFIYGGRIAWECKPGKGMVDICVYEKGETTNITKSTMVVELEPVLSLELLVYLSQEGAPSVRAYHFPSGVSDIVSKGGIAMDPYVSGNLAVYTGVEGGETRIEVVYLEQKEK